MQKYVVLEKKEGETPLLVLERYKEENPKLAQVPMAYAGRLDPMAKGKLLVLIGDECKQQEKYFGLDKEYEFEVLLGFSSDTGDVLGLGILDEKTAGKKYSDRQLRKVSRKLTNDISLPYPKFSSKTVGGKPLFLWTLEKRLDEITIPTKDSVIYHLWHTETRSIPKHELYSAIFQKINSIPPVTEPSKELGADFRRDEIRKRWDDVFDRVDKNMVFSIARFSCVCSSGTYMRTLSEVVAQELGTSGLAFSINRTKMGHYVKVLGPFGVWVKTY